MLSTGACAARGGRAEHPVAKDSPAAHAVAAAPAARKQAGTRREMTWAEYYTEVMERVRRRGGMVIWVNPPQPVPVSARQSGNLAADLHQ